MKKVLKDLPFAIAYLDDIIIYSKTAWEHLDHLQHMFFKLYDTEFTVKLRNCHFFAKEIQYLGYILCSTGIKPLPSNTSAIKLMKPPKNAKQVRAFLGLGGYYHKFIRNFVHIAKPLTALTDHDVKFIWTWSHLTALNTLKSAWPGAPILHYPLSKFLNRKNAPDKVNKWSQELTMYNIIFEWIPVACNKTTDYHSWLVGVNDTPTTHTASVNMLVPSSPDGPATLTLTHRKTFNSANTTSPKDPTTTSIDDKVIRPPSLTEDWKDTSRLMQRMDACFKCISNRLHSGKAPLHEANTFTHIECLVYKHVMDSNQRFLAIVTPRTYLFIKC